MMGHAVIRGGDGPMLTLRDLERAAREQGYPADTVNTGGGVVALSIHVNGADALVSLDGGQRAGSTWSVSLDSDTREQYGEMDPGDCPVISDADQTIRDAVAMVRHMVWGDVLADGAFLDSEGACTCPVHAETPARVESRWSDQEVAMRMQVAELVASYEDTREPYWQERYREFDERFGKEANENLASWCTGVHASSEDMLMLCSQDWDRYVEIMRGNFGW